MEVTDSKGDRYLFDKIPLILIGDEDFLKDKYNPWVFNGVKFNTQPITFSYAIFIPGYITPIFIFWSSINNWYYYYEAKLI